MTVCPDGQGSHAHEAGTEETNGDILADPVVIISCVDDAFVGIRQHVSWDAGLADRGIRTTEASDRTGTACASCCAEHRGRAAAVGVGCRGG